MFHQHVQLKLFQKSVNIIRNTELAAPKEKTPQNNTF